MTFEPVAGAFEVEHVGVVHDPVDHRGRDGGVAEDLAPPPEGQVAREDQGRVFVTARDELEEQVRGVLIEGDVADLVADQHAVTAKPGQLRGELAAGVSLLEPGDPPGRGVEQDPVTVVGGLDAERDGEVGLPRPGWPEQDDVLRLGDEHAGAEVGDQVPVGGGLVVEVEVFQGLVAGEPGRFDPQGRAGRFPLGDLAGEDRGEVFLMGPAGVAGLVAQAPERVTDPGRAERPGVVLDLRCRTAAHATTSRSARSLPVSTAKSVS